VDDAANGRFGAGGGCAGAGGGGGGRRVIKIEDRTRIRHPRKLRSTRASRAETSAKGGRGPPIRRGCMFKQLLQQKPRSPEKCATDERPPPRERHLVAGIGGHGEFRPPAVMESVGLTMIGSRSCGPNDIRKEERVGHSGPEARTGATARSSRRWRAVVRARRRRERRDGGLSYMDNKRPAFYNAAEVLMDGFYRRRLSERATERDRRVCIEKGRSACWSTGG